MTNEQHNKYLAISFLVHGGFQLLVTLFILLLFIFIAGAAPPSPGRGEPPAAFFAVLGVFIFFIQLIFTAPALVAAYALLKRKAWARTAGIVGAVLAGMSFPIGTAVCVYALWFLLGEGGKQMYPEKGAPARGELPYSGDFVTWEEQARRAERANAPFPPPPPSPPDWR